MDQPDPSQLRISDQDRHKVADMLRDAAGEGRIDLEELDERLEAAYAAKVYADLVPLTMDLPNSNLPAPMIGPGPVTRQAHAGSAPAGMPLSSPASSVAVLSGVDRRGPWLVSQTHTAFSMMGEVTLDLRQASFAAAETVINANTVMGSIDIYVNAGTHVIVEGVGLMGSFEQGRDRVPPDYGPQAPVIRVKGFALMGAVTVTRKRMPGEPGKLKKMLGT
ncbi:DUF1707 SHOCT-like domain-containing protein [Nocardioides gilvus]|uniref:DUF1707 SHOCT-like domain-containing protein n=1 Tax=Nocardioides gilvus TaxID=1735589 RepID=UPI000D746127|nr:DUF1707 domain-containing protein [Nocardioides gilvus]